MASWTFRRASSRLPPWLMHPGSDGTSATNTPSSSWCTNTRNFTITSCGLRDAQRPKCTTARGSNHPTEDIANPTYDAAPPMVSNLRLCVQRPRSPAKASNASPGPVHCRVGPLIGLSAAIKQMPELSMRSALAHADESQPLKQHNHFARREDRDRSHGYATWIVWMPTNSDSSFGSPSSRSISTTS